MKVKSTNSLEVQNVLGLEASAGSGKTYALAKRYVQLLMDPELTPGGIPLRYILAITFTNKAAFEMKDRILEFLKKIALDTFSDQDERNEILSSLSLSKKEASLKARTVMDYIIRNYNFFQVQTIDSFINSLLTSSSFLLDLSSVFTIKRDFDDYLEYSLDQLLDRVNSDKNVRGMFDSFLKQYLFIENKEAWYPKGDMLSLVASLFSVSNVFGCGFKKYDMGKKNIVIKKRQIVKLIAELNKDKPEGTNKSFEKSIIKFLNERKDNFDVGDLSNFFKREEFPVKKNSVIPPNIQKNWSNLRRSIKELCEWQAFSLFNCYIDIFNESNKYFKELQSKDDVVFLSELNRRARTLFEKKIITMDELYCRMSARFNHFLMDEFQDTSTLQWKNFFLLIKEALLNKGSLFYVGDKKQAIYRFRGGDARLFDMVGNEFKAFNPKLDILSKNYRSQKAIVEFNNKVFSKENIASFVEGNFIKEGDKKSTLALGDIDNITDVFRASKQSYKAEKSSGYVKVELLENNNREERDIIARKKILSLIKELTKRFSYNEIAILTRSNDEVELVTTWLLEEKIPVTSDKTLNIREHPVIKELVSFLKFLHSPIDDLFFASFILGDVFSKTSSVDTQKIRDFVFSLNKDRTRKAAGYLYKEFQKKYPALWKNFISEFFKNVGAIPVYEFVISILRKYSVIKNFPEAQGFIMRFLELIKEEESEHTSLALFLDFFETAQDDNLYVNVTNEKAIRILTIHQSKGLEFNVVVLPFLAINIKPGRVAGLGQSRWGRPFSSSCLAYYNDKEKKLDLVYMNRKFGEYSNRLWEIYREEYKRALIDELNSIYVAMTRPRNELYIFIPNKSSKGYNTLTSLIPNDYYEVGVKDADKKEIKRKEEVSLFKIPPSTHCDWLHVIKEEFIETSEITNRHNIQKGDILHFIFSFIDNLADENMDTLVKEAILKARFKYPFIDDLKEYEKMVKKALKSPKLKSFFFVKDGDIYREKDIVGSDGKTRRIDRLIIKKDECVIVDYKSSTGETEKYRRQIDDYKTIVKGIYPKRKVKGYLLYLDELRLEEV